MNVVLYDIIEGHQNFGGVGHIDNLLLSGAANLLPGHFHIPEHRIIFFVAKAVRPLIVDKDDQRDAACCICLYYACGSTLHVSGALCTHHQECIETVHAESGTIVF